jgi:hypothetical protein
LGVIIDEKLDWKEHVNLICKKVSKGIGVLRLCKPYVPSKTLEILYSTIILPHFDYCCPVWGQLLHNFENKFTKAPKQSSKNHYW